MDYSGTMTDQSDAQKPLTRGNNRRDVQCIRPTAHHC